MPGRWIDDTETQGHVRLFCFAHAGSGGGFFRSWKKQLNPEITVNPIMLPGREARWRESAHTHMDELIQPLCEAIMPYLDRPFAFFGHSMGAVIAFEMTRRLSQRPDSLPLCLFVSARRMPHLAARQPEIYKLPTEEFLVHLEQLNGTSSSLLQEPELLKALLPSLRADFQLNDTYTPPAGEQLPLPIWAFVGDRDKLVTINEMRRWGELTVAEFRLQVFSGDHFYLTASQSEVLAAIRNGIARALCRNGLPGLGGN
jgi:medium-chain acyl-[acyl-carrier-protein] hydrolase